MSELSPQERPFNAEQPASEKVALPRPCLMLVTEPADDLVWRVCNAVEGGVNTVQFRKQGVTKEDFAAQIEPVAAASLSIEFRALQMFNGFGMQRCDVLYRGGIHLSERSLDALKFMRNLCLYRFLLGVSVHSVGNSLKAADLGADYLIAGTIFRSASHPDIEPQGLGFLEEVCNAVSIPVIAIGGITPENASECIEAGAAGVAALSGIMRAEDPRTAAEAYRERLNACWNKVNR